MARQLLISDDEETLLRNIFDMSIRGFKVQAAMYGDSPELLKEKSLIVGLARKVGMKLPDDDAPALEPGGALAERMAPPSLDMSRLMESMNEHMGPMMRDIHPSQLERVALPVFVRLFADNLQAELDHPNLARDCAKDAIDAARAFLAIINDNQAPLLALRSGDE